MRRSYFQPSELFNLKKQYFFSKNMRGRQEMSVWFVELCVFLFFFKKKKKKVELLLHDTLLAG